MMSIVTLDFLSNLSHIQPKVDIAFHLLLVS